MNGNSLENQGDVSESTLDQLKLLIVEICGVEPSIVQGEARLRAYGLDSIRITELILSIEDTFAVQLRVEEMSDIATVADLAKYIDGRRAEE